MLGPSYRYVSGVDFSQIQWYCTSHIYFMLMGKEGDILYSR